MSSGESESSLTDGSDESSFRCLRRFFFFLLLFFCAHESDDDVSDESDDEGSGSGFPSGSCSFSFFSKNSVGRLSSSKTVGSASSLEAVGCVNI